MEFYSYLWLREDGTPYYAGKGTGKRAFRSLGHGSLNCPKDRARILVFSMLSEAEAFESEMALIELFGRVDLGTGFLRNLTMGGDGVRGYCWTESHRAQVSKRLKGKPQSLKLVAKRAKALKRYWDSNPDCEVRNAKISEKSRRWFAEHSKEEIQARKAKMTRLGHKHTPETRAKLAEARKGQTPNKGHRHTEETKQKMRLAHQRRRKQNV